MDINISTRKKGVNIVVLLIVIIFVLISYVVVNSSPRATGQKLHQMRRIRLLYHTDHEELLQAGREILSQGPKDPKNYRYLGPMHIDGFPVPRNVRIPKVVHKLKTHANLINFNGYVVLQMKEGVVGYGVKIFPEDFKAPRSTYFSYGNKELLPGLWYYDVEYRHIPQYDKTIDYIIKKGKYPEPNEIDLNK
ncbi:MAG: hypothetical protein GY845_12135 [Planctomycetes bacterium]|nr:hypothetical protein [Planctomycetota bacterium]